MIEKIINCYDSHTHFWATGQVSCGLKLNSLKNAQDIKSLEIKKEHYRANWLTGFGWNQNIWENPRFPDKSILDELFPQTPVFLSRVDGHASWINSAAIEELKKLGYDFSNNPKGGIVDRDDLNQPTGILLDQAHISALLKLPDFNIFQHQSFIEESQSIFNKAGFTHIRDLSMNLNLWQLLRKMEDQKNLTLAIEAFVTVESLDDLDRVLNEIEQIKKDTSKQLRLCGVKIFIDGSLGSKTAYLSESYLNTDSNGILIWSADEIKTLLKRVWPLNLEVAIHTIGDGAVHTAVSAAREVSAEGVLGRLHLEHVQILRPETLQLMKPLHITCHMQPCHWLSDESWLKQNLSENLVQKLFPWEQLRKNKIAFDFGSDAPIERPSLFDNQKALTESVKWGIPKLNADWKTFHTHPDLKWCPSFTEIDNGKIKKVFFNQQEIL